MATLGFELLLRFQPRKPLIFIKYIFYLEYGLLLRKYQYIKKMEGIMKLLSTEEIMRRFAKVNLLVPFGSNGERYYEIDLKKCKLFISKPPSDLFNVCFLGQFQNFTFELLYFTSVLYFVSLGTPVQYLMLCFM